MTVHTIASEAGPFNGDGVTTTFPFSITLIGSAQLKVIRITRVGIEEVLTAGIDYTLSLNADQQTNPGGVVEYIATGGGLPIGESLFFKRIVDLLQITDLQSLGDYPPAEIEHSLDKLTMITQQLNDGVSALKASFAEVDRVRFAVLGASETVFPWQRTWVDLIDGAFKSEGIKVEFFHTGAGAITHHMAMTQADSLTGETRVELTSNSDPDVIIVELGINDAILSLENRSQSQLIADARALYAHFRDNNPRALIIYSRLVPYDEEKHQQVAVEDIKKKYCIPFMHQTSGMPGETDLYTSEYAEIDKLISPEMQERLANWRVLDVECRALADVSIDTSYFQPARLGLLSHDRFHPNSLGHYFIMSRVWKFFQTDTTVRAAIPVLNRIRNLGNFTDFIRLWRSVLKVDADRDGYVVDPGFLSGWEYPMWMNIYGHTNLIYNIEFWANQQRPTISVSGNIDKANGDLLMVMMNDLFPNREIETKLWLEGEQEPSTWTRSSPRLFTSPTGGYVSARQNVNLGNGTWYMKYKIASDVFGPFVVSVFG
jgi:lysophospholipase L1-like esterase